ncbi:endonuclease IV [Amylolactobacillus amylotrophicus DSM 20534]|uniref:Deoxyribonuclease IV n=4 Tax=Lactobacillaceae TaxID=33958 RepID=A0A1L6XE51_9LACO|nr:deoxyribonuclease IV [Amylolactobacillus amylophilus DSM 20533 = JCM 1125]KRK38473.1 endonuclease IV [Amylolactobacillus amylotrophicus DSM 20534]KRM42884.1 endonuclease IV [Amylolactobacillus amylophilus DSM 20533 = JCM 1125]
MGGTKMLVGAAEESMQNGANTMMVFTGAPQNTRRKELSAFNIEAGKALLKEAKIAPVVVHAPYIINLGNTIKTETLGFAEEFLLGELERAEAIGASTISFHPGAHVGAGSAAAIKQIAQMLDRILGQTATKKVTIAIETMAGKGTEVGKTFEELASIITQTSHNDRLAITFDTCHVYDGGYDIKNDLSGVLTQFDQIVGLDRISTIHLNDSKFGLNSHKDRHANLGYGELGFQLLNTVAYLPELKSIPKIMETPLIVDPANPKKKYSPYKFEISELRQQTFDPALAEHVLAENK